MTAREFIVNSVEPESHLLVDDGPFPNNAHLPLLVYRQSLGTRL